MSNSEEAFKRLKQAIDISYYIGPHAAQAIENACCGSKAKVVSKAPEEKAISKQDFPSSDNGHKNKKLAKATKKSED